MPSLPTNPRDADAAITGSRFVSLGDAPFYRGSINTGDGDTALIFASDGQLELLRSCRLVYVDVTFRVHGAFVVLSAIYGLRPAHRSFATINYYSQLHHLAFHACLFPRFPVLHFGAAFSSSSFSNPAF